MLDSISSLHNDNDDHTDVKFDVTVEDTDDDKGNETDGSLYISRKS